MDFGAGPERRRGLHTLERICGTMARAGRASGLYAVQSLYYAFFQRCILERMGRDAKLNGIPGSGDSWASRNVAAAPALAEFPDDRSRNGSDHLLAGDTSGCK